MAIHHRNRPPFVYPQQRREASVDPEIWRACAGTMVKIPAVQSRVYYFPQGHMEQASSNVSLSPLVASKPSIPCRVAGVKFCADRNSDEVFAKISLEPLSGGFRQEPASGQNAGEGSSAAVASFSKVLTPSDANNGGGFSVPRFCADTIFPPLNYEEDPPLQIIGITDVHGEVWSFRHIYRGTPRRHLLTTGWSKFVNSKKLIAGDSVVFMRNKLTKQLFVGIRRAVKSEESSKWAQKYVCSADIVPVIPAAEGGFSRNGRGRVPSEVVLEAAERAANHLPFEVVYYPRTGSPDFVVAADKVEEANNLRWSPGMRVKMAMETEDSSRMTWCQGTVASVDIDNGLWRGTFWRMLQVQWDEPEALQNMKRVSPWQVEVIASTPSIHLPFPPAKRFRVPLVANLHGEGNISLPTIEFTSVMGQLSPPFLKYNSFPAGMQGARQNPLFGSNLANIMSDGAHQMCPDNHAKIMPQVDSVSTDLSIGSSSCGTPSPDRQNSVQFFGVDASGQILCNSSRKLGTTRFQLFGKIISTEQPAHDINFLGDPCLKLADFLGAQC